MKTTKEVGDILAKTFEFAKSNSHEYVTPEHLLYILTFCNLFQSAFENCGGNIKKLQEKLQEYFVENILAVQGKEPHITQGLQKILLDAHNHAINCEKNVVELPHLIGSLLDLKESHAVYFMSTQEVESTSLMCEVCVEEEEKNGSQEVALQQEMTVSSAKWRQYVECLNDNIDNINPLIGRSAELERTIQILCRKDKNNPLHIGEAGVGKTAITYGLARMLVEDANIIPTVLKGANIFSIDLGGMLAGTQFRGDFEKRFKEVMDGISKEEKPIVYIDEIHNIVGAGAVNDGSLDVSNMLKPYLQSGNIRFIGATTYEEYKKYFSKSKSLVRRFQNVDIKEPSEEETLQILEGLKVHYEKFHKVKYGKGVLEYAVSLSSKYRKERCLPDKAIDLIDEAGAFRQLHPLDKKTQTVGKDLIDDVLSKICNIPKQIVEQNEVKKLQFLDKKLTSQIFGQEEAVDQVVNAIKFSRAGLLEEGKPLASLLFVGPTGVGKTEVARVLSKELGIPLIRLDMSEYAEKHAVAKLIGSPAGYVGYEEGGLLTEEIRKNPHAVLLLDEIEKAHGDIYNILLQVMDYATLTDNQGRKADFRNVILIMTSNAGASGVGKDLIGYGGRTASLQIIQDEVKRIFQPEFRNRLNRIVVFHGINDEMAVLITQKKLDSLSKSLLEKKVDFIATERTIDYLKTKGISKDYGAREIDRVINQEVKPLLVDQILFGKLKKGGYCHLDFLKDKFVLNLERG